MNDFIEQVIRNYVRKHRVKMLLTSKKISGVISVFYYNWVDCDGHYYSLLAPCSKICVLWDPSANFDDALDLGRRKFNCKAEWDDGKWTTEDAVACEKRVFGEMYRIRQYCNCRFGDYVFNGTDFYVETIPTLVIWYEYKNEVKNIIITYGEKTILDKAQDGLFDFAEGIGLHNFVEWEDSRRLLV